LLLLNLHQADDKFNWAELGIKLLNAQATATQQLAGGATMIMILG
jgi:hypothetical protein